MLCSFNKARGDTALHAAVTADNPELVTVLLDAGLTTHINDTNMHNDTAAVQAAYLNRPKVLAVLIARGADLVKGYPLHVAARFCHIETTSMLLDAGIDINSFDRDDHTPLDLVDNDKREESMKERVYTDDRFEKMINFLISRGGKTSTELHARLFHKL